MQSGRPAKSLRVGAVPYLVGRPLIAGLGDGDGFHLSFAVPASAASVVLETILASIILKERVDRRRWMGVACVALGVYLLAL